MTPLKAALLDDNPEQLHSNQQYLTQSGLVTVVTACVSAKDFINEVKLSTPEVLFLDLNLGDSYMTGMEVAYALKLPVLFVSSNTAQYVKEMETLQREHDVCVEHLTKPFSEAELVKTTRRFINEITFYTNKQFVYFDFGAHKRTKIALESIVFLSADKANGAESNNKRIHFTDRKPEKLIDFSFSRMEEKGLLKSDFITIHKSFRVHKKHIVLFDKKNEEVEVMVYDASGKRVATRLPVSENYVKEVVGSLRSK